MLFPPHQTEGLANGRGPVLIRAHASRDGAVHEVVMRLEVTQYGTSQVQKGGRGRPCCGVAKR